MRGLHWRGLSLKIACWPVYLAGTLLAIGRAEIPYIPTAKEAQRGHFFRLAWPHLIVAAAFLITLFRTLYRRLILESESSLFLSSEATWGMMGFASFAVLLTSGGIYAAWEARNPPQGATWDAVDLEAIQAP